MPIWKEPTDLRVYQHILFEPKPDLIIETGTLLGGSAMYLASICDLMDRGRVISVDIEHIQPLPQHSRIEYILGSSTAPTIIDRLRNEANECETVLVILDSDHRYDHVSQELRLYAPLVRETHT